MEAPRRIEVDGQQFDVSTRDELPGQYDVAWVSGPNAGYGFRSATSDGSPMSRAHLVSVIRGFLKQVDADTGYIE
jgi:hypothetical protein